MRIAGRKAPPFQLQFWGKRLNELRLDTASAGEGIAAISGATHTSRAVVDAAWQAAERIIARIAEARLTRHRQAAAEATLWSGTQGQAE